VRYPELIVGAFILNKNGELLLIEGVKWGKKLFIPGGHVELNETLENALKREVLEEVGLDIDVLALLGVQEQICSSEFYKKKHFIFLDYVCKAINLTVQIDKREAQKFLWIHPNAALNLNLSGGTRKTIETFLKKDSSAWKR